MSTFTYSYKPDAMLFSLGCIFLKKAASFLKGRLTCVLIQQGNNFFKLIFPQLISIFQKDALSRGWTCVWEYGTLEKYLKSVIP